MRSGRRWCKTAWWHLWATRSDDRPFAIGVPEPYDVLPLPRLSSQVLVPPWQTVLFISSRVEDPSACLTVAGVPDHPR
jgi:hypothetical protein